MTNDSQAIPRRVLEQVQKLMALSADPAATEGEAQAAASRAQAIMLKHNLTMATLEARGGAADGAARSKVQTQGRAGYQYQRDLMMTVARTNFCALLYTYNYGQRRTTVKGYTLVGREANVAAAQHLFDYLNGALERIVTPHLSSNAERCSRWAISFKEGAAQRLRERLSERFDEEQRAQSAAARAHNTQAASSGTDLVVVMEDFAQAEADANEDFRRGLKPGTTAERRARMRAEGIERERVERERRANLTEEERAAEDAKAEKQNARWHAKWERRWNAKWANKDIRAYNAGREAGDSIGLDRQVTREDQQQIN